METFNNKLVIYQFWPEMSRNDVFLIYSYLFISIQLFHKAQKSNIGIETIVSWFRNIQVYNLVTPAEVRMLMALVEDANKLTNLNQLIQILQLSENEINQIRELNLDDIILG